MGSWLHSPNSEVIVRLLVSARQKAGLTQRDLAARIGKSPAYVANIERGERRVDLIEFIAITRALGANDVEAYSQISARIDGEPKI